MLSIRSVAVGLVGACVLTAGCLGPSDTAPVGSAELRARREVVPIGLNGLKPGDFWNATNRAALRALGGAALVAAGDAVVATPLLATAGGRSVLDHLVRCALPLDGVVYDPGGEAFYGEFGFAPEWTGRALNTSEQRWVSACMFQHLNGSGEHVDILLDGRHPSLDFSRDEEPFAEFIVEDATTYGNAFLSGAIVGFTCINPDLAGALSALSLSCPLDLNLLVLERSCGLLPTCGMAFVGVCDLACTKDAAGDQTCHTLPLLGPLLSPLLGSAYPETIRTELRASDVLPLYSGCGLL
ncbi:hypothetical protein BE15_19455 [Sorangium cellulosum]|uniref:Uncharacterized protein n=1 Tax=Sorangium cellulosum TaxID=56 RepID=A0A150R2H3_SORCE|nr:hypothetical protein BE15_19455 [Sorangium cellulosum]